MTTKTPDHDHRFDKAVDIVLDSGILVERQIAAFWAYVDGDITEDEARERIR